MMEGGKKMKMQSDFDEHNINKVSNNEEHLTKKHDSCHKLGAIRI